MTPSKTETLKMFDEGYYSFRFEYTDKDGNRRFEVGVWNDGMPAKEALRKIAKHVAEYEDGRITDFVENKYFKSLLRLARADERKQAYEDGKNAAVDEIWNWITRSWRPESEDKDGWNMKGLIAIIESARKAKLLTSLQQYEKI